MINLEGNVKMGRGPLPMAGEDVVRQRPKRAEVLSVEPGSASFEAGVLPGDILRSVNGVPTLDIVDFQFHTAGEEITVEVERNGEPVSFRMVKGYDEFLGMEFADDLFDRVHICKNKCVFCFLYQQPKGLRPSLYIKDDDYRLSFLHGNYLTLTNMGDAEFARVIAQKLSPLFVSVHATDPDVRGKMLGRSGPEPILPRLAMLADSRICVHAQIVLCPGYNDGAVLEQTVRELSGLHPERRGSYGGVLSVAVVPVGLTQFRDRLAALTSVSAEYAGKLIAEVAGWRKAYRKELGTSFVFPSDEFYVSSQTPVPSAKAYEGFPLLEDGIGLVRQFIDDHARISRKLPKSVAPERTATMVTGELASHLVNGLAETLNHVDGVHVNVATVHNTFFEGNITVAGLLTGRDIAHHLKGLGNAVGDMVIIPSIMLRDPDRDMFLDDMTIPQFEDAVGRKLVVVDRMPSSAANAILGRMA